MRGLLIAAFALTGTMYASTAYSIPAGYSDTDGPVSGTVAFSLTNCVTGPTASCTLNIFVTDTQANPTAAGQEISGVTFALMNAGTSLSSLPTLSSTISNGSGGAVTVLDSSFNATTTTATPSSWKLQSGGSGYYLNDLTGGQPQNMIIGPGPYTNANPSITNHSPSLAGTVEFSIPTFVGLTSATVLSQVKVFFGTGPDANTTLACTSGCTGGTIQGSSTPEPATVTLCGGVLVAIGYFRRRHVFARR